MAELKVYVCDRCDDRTEPTKEIIVPSGQWVKITMEWREAGHTERKHFHLCELCARNSYGVEFNRPAIEGKKP